MIPKIIHFCWFGGQIPKRFTKVIQSWESILPEYKFYFWSDEHLREYDIKFLRQAKKKKHFAFVADYFRLRKVYEIGGFYLDLDMLLVKSLNEFLELEFVIGSEIIGRPNWAFFGSEPQNCFLKSCFELYHELEYDQFKPPVIPYFLKDKTLDYINIDVKKRKNLNPEYFYPMPVERCSLDYRIFIGKDTVGVHLWDFSWLEIKLQRSKSAEFFYRTKILVKDFFTFQYSPYYFRINFIRIIRLLKK